jgi:hypothetical protein
MSERWLRWYDGTVRDGKFRVVSELSDVPVCTVIGVWASLLEDASTNTPRGIADKGVEFHSLWLGIAEHEIGTVWNGMERVGLIERNGDEIVILNWSRRQFETDGKDPTAKERKSRWKQRHRSGGTERNAQERSGTPETETESKTDKKERYWSFEKFWSAYPKKKAKKAAERAFRKVEREGEVSLEGLIGAIATITKDEKFIPYPASWLNAGGYLDGQAAPPPSNELSPEEQANRDYWLAELAKEKHAEGTELGKASSVVEAKFGHREGSRKLGSGSSWVPRIQRMGRAFQAGNGSNSAVYDDGNPDQQGSDVAGSVAKSTGTE